MVEPACAQYGVQSHRSGYTCPPHTSRKPSGRPGRRGGSPWENPSTTRGNHGEVRKTQGKIMKSHGEKREKYRDMPPEVYFNSVWENPSKWWMLKCHVSLGNWEKVEEFTNGDKIGIWVWVKIRYPKNWMVNTKLD